MTSFNMTISKGVPELGITVKDDKAMVSSREIAKEFEKEHKHVIRDIREKILPHTSPDFGQSNFVLSSYINKQNKKQPEYLLTRDGFTIVAMGYTGKKAMEFKEAYIRAFNSMKDLITTRLLSKQGYREMTDMIKECISNDWRDYAKESNMINQIVLGMSSKEFKKAHGLKKE